MTDETAVIDSFVLRVQLVCRQLQLVQQTIDEFDQQIAAAYAAHPDRHDLCQPAGSRTGAGPAAAGQPGLATRTLRGGQPTCSVTPASRR